MGRPTWDEYFMEVMESLSKRATCDRGKSAAIFVKENQILCTGYVGSPPGLPHCDDVGHMMEKRTRYVNCSDFQNFVPFGDKEAYSYNDEGMFETKTTHHCIRTIHAEENGILQAAKIGVPLKGSTLYCRMTPCSRCAMQIISVGVTRVVCQKKYHAGRDTEIMFEKVGIKLDILEDITQEYPGQ